jgi:hypothetical protein
MFGETVAEGGVPAGGLDGEEDATATGSLFSATCVCRDVRSRTINNHDMATATKTAVRTHAVTHRRDDHIRSG